MKVTSEALLHSLTPFAGEHYLQPDQAPKKHTEGESHEPTIKRPKPETLRDEMVL
jgi:hypothetical protein